MLGQEFSSVLKLKFVTQFSSDLATISPSPLFQGIKAPRENFPFSVRPSRLLKTNFWYATLTTVKFLFLIDRFTAAIETHQTSDEDRQEKLAAHALDDDKAARNVRARYDVTVPEGR